MATLANIPFEYYRCSTDDYLLPNGTVIDGYKVFDARREAKDRRDASTAYDPYNHTGKRL